MSIRRRTGLQVEALENRMLLDANGFVTPIAPSNFVPAAANLTPAADDDAPADTSSNDSAGSQDNSSAEDGSAPAAVAASTLPSDDSTASDSSMPSNSDPVANPSNNEVPTNDDVVPVDDFSKGDSKNEPVTPVPAEAEMLARVSELDLRALWSAHDNVKALFSLDAGSAELDGSGPVQHGDVVPLPGDSNSESLPASVVSQEDDWALRLTRRPSSASDQTDDEVAVAAATTDEQPGTPHASGWLYDSLPLDVNALDQGLRRLLEEIEGLGLRLADLSLFRVPPWLVAAAVTALACELSRRQLQPRPRVALAGLRSWASPSAE